MQSAAALAAVDSDNGSDADDAEALFATIPSAQTAEAVSSEAEDEPTKVAEVTVIEEVQIDYDDAPIGRDMSGITPDGRAVNDPRVDARPIEEVIVQTAIGSVFGTEAFPDAPHYASMAPRAANDPRGPRIDEPAANDELIEENEVADA